MLKLILRNLGQGGAGKIPRHGGAVILLNQLFLNLLFIIRIDEPECNECVDIGGGTVLLCEFENLVQLLSQIFCKYFPIRLVHRQALILQAQKHGFHPAILAYREALMASRRKKLVIVYGLLRSKREQIVLLYVPS